MMSYVNSRIIKVTEGCNQLFVFFFHFRSSNNSSLFYQLEQTRVKKIVELRGWRQNKNSYLTIFLRIYRMSRWLVVYFFIKGQKDYIFSSSFFSIRRAQHTGCLKSMKNPIFSNISTISSDGMIFEIKLLIDMINLFRTQKFANIFLIPSYDYYIFKYIRNSVVDSKLDMILWIR